MSIISLNVEQRKYLNAYNVGKPKADSAEAINAQISNIDFLLTICSEDMSSVLKKIRGDWEYYLTNDAPPPSKPQRFNWDVFCSENEISPPDVFETDTLIVKNQIDILKRFAHSRDIPMFARNKVRDFISQQRNILSALNMSFGKTSAQKSKPIHAIQRKEKARAKSAEARRHNGKKG